MQPYKDTKLLTKRDALNLLNEIDRELKEFGLQRKIKLYCIGSTEMLFENLKNSSNDVDFVLSRKDFRVTGSIKEDIESKKHVRIDMFPDGEMPDFTFSDYERYSKPAGYKFDKIDLYYIDRSAVLLTKFLAGRDKDFKDIKILLKHTKLSKEKLEEIFHSLKIDKDKEKKVKDNFKKFIEIYFKR